MHVPQTPHIVLAVLVLGTLVATCYHALSLQRSLSNNIISNERVERVVNISSTPPNDERNHSTTSLSSPPTDVRNHSTVAPFHMPNSSGTPQQAVLNASTPHNATIPHCTPPFSSSGNSRSIPKRHIFVDFGANDAHSVELFLNSSTIYWNEIESYSKRVANLRQTNMTGAMLGWEVHVFEANPNPLLLDKREQQRLHMISNNLTRSYHLYSSTAITTHDGHIEFILDNNQTGSSGSTTMNESASAVGTRVNVTAVDIVSFLKNLQIREIDEVVIKMDVEGAEYALCRRMIAYCLFPLIDRIAIEWHHHNQFVLGKHGDKYKAEHHNIMQALTDRGWQNKVLEWA